LGAPPFAEDVERFLLTRYLLGALISRLFFIGAMVMQIGLPASCIFYLVLWIIVNVRKNI
jgi:hypothetical protein